MTWVCLHRRDETCNMRRFYVLQVQQTLFGQWELVREFGRIGSPGRVLAFPYPTEAEASLALDKLRATKEARGYRQKPHAVSCLR